METIIYSPEDNYATRLQQGDEDAFRYVMHRYFPVIFQFAGRFLVNKAAAEDVAAETFIKLWKDHEKVGNFQSIKAFLYITAKNACLNEIRKDRNLDKRHHVYVANQPEESYIASEIIRAEVKAELYKAIETLPEKMKRVFELGFIEGLPNREIAKVLNVSVNTVKTQKARALELLKERLAGKDILPVILLLLSTIHHD